jgi:hypothetical protein
MSALLRRSPTRPEFYARVRLKSRAVNSRASEVRCGHLSETPASRQLER